MGIAIIVPNVSFESNNLGKVTLTNGGSSSGGDSTIIAVSAIEISGPSKVLNADSNTATYSAIYTPSNTTQKGVTWSIESGSDYASISQDGTLTVKKSGSVTIKATSTHKPSIVATKTVSVTFVGQGTLYPVELQSITIDGSETVNTNSNTATYSVVYLPVMTTQKGVTWSIESGSDYASISQDGTLTVKKSGSVTIKATSTHKPSIVATKNVSVTFVGQGTDVSTPQELAYIGTEGGNYLKTSTIFAVDNSKVKAKVNLPVVTHTANTRQFILHDGKNINIGNNYGSANTFNANLPRIAILFNGIQNGICELECSRYTHNLTNNGNTVEVKSTSNQTITDTGAIHLFASPAVTSKDNKRVDIYYFKFLVSDVEQLSLVPFLKDGKPCFYDEVSKTYLFITGSKNIYYATKDNPTNELTYNG